MNYPLTELETEVREKTGQVPEEEEDPHLRSVPDFNILLN